MADDRVEAEDQRDEVLMGVTTCLYENRWQAAYQLAKVLRRVDELEAKVKELERKEEAEADYRREKNEYL